MSCPSQEGSCKFWDHALDKGAAGTSSALALLKLLTLIPYNGICPIKGCKATIEDDTAAAHFLSLHTDLIVSLEECLNAVVTCSEDFFCLGLSLHTYFRSLSSSQVSLACPFYISASWSLSFVYPVTQGIVNPQRACAARVTVVGSVCVCVCVSVT